MTFYGASVIHPKTIKPLANKNIPLWVKSFMDPSAHGTLITNCNESQNIPTFVHKSDQVLVTFRVTDFTFINEIHLHRIYAVLEKLKIRVNLLQTSAISVSLCLDKQFIKIEKLIGELKEFFSIRYNENLKLLTVLHHHQEIVQEIEEGKEIFLEQRTRNTYHIVFKELNGEDD
jgi:aspartate kinase